MMASLSEERGQRGSSWRIQVKVDDRRRTIRLGQTTKKQATAALRHVEALAAARIDGSAPPEATAAWLRDVSETLRQKLERAGLVRPRSQTQVVTIGQLIEDYRRSHYGRLAKATRTNYTAAFNDLTIHLGGDRPIAGVTPADAEDFRRTLLEAGRSDATARRRCSAASMLLRHACRRRWIDRDPFDEAAVPRSAIATKRKAFVEEAAALRVLWALPTDEWRLAFALARWGGMRVGELRRLTWRDVDWERCRFRVTSQKTAHHEGKGERWTPLFDPPLEQLFRVAFEAAEEGETQVLPMLRGKTEASLRKPLQAAIQRAEVEPWPRLWQNLRATRQTELAATVPAHQVAAWLGNSVAVAAKHYLMVTDDDYVEAAKNPAHNPAHFEPPEGSGSVPERTTKKAAGAVFPGIYANHRGFADSGQSDQMLPLGVQLEAESPAKSKPEPNRGSQSGSPNDGDGA